MAAKVTPLSEMLATRKEALGTEDRFDWPVDDEKSFQVRDPRMASEAWRDELVQLGRDFEDGELLPSEFSRELIEMYLDDQTDDYLALFEGMSDPASTARELLTDAVKSWVEQTDPTQKSSRATRRRSKQR
ncbi:hypothetical protein NCCP2495_05400 [Dietzia sp. NCCP-2495]|uniref:hypothetical protein n=1 Tax=Dietzia sp. NCCP-2495 TaxID=2934675 RepID=UPI002232B608|nr:hypothetical protein [Dietzia sp. NCCP-2495]GLB62662.1 hypothetical protein NCCP2495_05400 [Dietzia sp. NCCP-2495]